MTDAIAQNSIPAKAVESAASAGKEAGAKYVICGGIAKDEDHFRVHTYVVDVGASKITASGSSRSNRSRTRPTIWVASSEWPPRAKKSSWMPIRSSPRSSCHTSAMRSSSSLVDGA